jgi:SAM-dependent methyltransferase
MPRLVETLRERWAHAVLDLGCGAGRHVASFAGYGFAMAGLDTSPPDWRSRSTRSARTSSARIFIAQEEGQNVGRRDVQPPDLTSFFMASAGAGAALTGLLFVAVSVNPGRNAGPSAPPERQAVAVSAFTALINAFFTSLAALISNDNLGVVTIAVSAGSIIATLRLIGDLFPPQLSRRNQVRHAGFLAISLLIYGVQFFYGFQFLFGFQYLGNPADLDYAYSIAYLLLAVHGVGLSRAWQLLGAKRRSAFSWFSPLNGLEETQPTPRIPSEESKAAHGQVVSAKPEDAHRA